MQILKNKTNFDFIGKRRPAMFISMVLNLAIIVGIAVFGFNFGVDFAGGTLVELKFDHPITAQDVRQRAKAGGLEDPTVQGIGAADENSFLLRLGGMTQLTADSAKAAEAAIRSLGTVTQFNADLDNGLINFRTKEKLEVEKVKAAVEQAKGAEGQVLGTGVKEVADLGEAQGGGFDYQVVASGMAERITAALMKDQAKPDFEQRRVDYVGPQVGKQLRNKGIMALIYATVAILIYVAFRFDFKFAPGAVLALLHDVVMVSGYYLVTRREFNLTSIAVLLTILGYSINDTIVIYDRIREEMVRFKGKPLTEIINISVNETLSRSILTSAFTALSLVGLLIFGVGEIWDFAAAMMVGLVVGMYSTIYIASPLTIFIDERSARKRAGGKPTSRPEKEPRAAAAG